MRYYFRALRNYAKFEGQASRKEFWWFYLFYYIFMILAMCLDYVCGTSMLNLMYTKIFLIAQPDIHELPMFALPAYTLLKFIGCIYFIYLYATYIPLIAISVRRLHDSGRTGWMFLVKFIPIPLVGTIWYLCLMAKKTKITNQYIEY